MAEDNGKQNPKESYTNKCQKHIASSYVYKLVCVDDKFSKLFKKYIGKDAVYNFVNNMIEESKYCSDVIKKELWITKEDNDNLKLNLKMSVFFHNIKNYGSLLIMQKLDKSNFKANVRKIYELYYH